MISTGIDTRIKVQQIIENQLPEFILSESPKAVDFLKQYYISQEYTGGPIDLTDNLDQYLKLDNLTPEVIVGVTTLTSLNNNDLKLIGYNKSVKNLVAHQAKLAKKANLDALVCSPYEVSAVRKIFKKEIITPGVQIGKKNYDQKRSMEAEKVNSDWLVIGRAITARGNIKKNIQNLIEKLR